MHEILYGGCYLEENDNTQPSYTDHSRMFDLYISNPVKVHNRASYSAFNDNIFNPTNLQQQPKTIIIHDIKRSIWPVQILYFNWANEKPEEWKPMKNSHYSLQVDEAIQQGNFQLHSRDVVPYHFAQKKDENKVLNQIKNCMLQLSYYALHKITNYHH